MRILATVPLAGADAPQPPARHPARLTSKSSGLLTEMAGRFITCV
jgi:hypothetical protein